MLEVRRVVHARCEHDDRRVGDAVGRRREERREEALRVVDDRPHPQAREQLGERPDHRAPVRDDVAHAAGHAHVVLEDAEPTGLVPDEVDARHVHAHAVRRLDAPRLPVELRRRQDEPLRHDAVGHGALRAVDVREERLERPHALRDAPRHDVPLVRLDDPRHDVEREGPLLSREVERHALGEVGTGERVGARRHLAGGEPRHRRVHALVARAQRAVVVEHLVPGPRHRVVVEQVRHARTVGAPGCRHVTCTCRRGNGARTGVA